MAVNKTDFLVPDTGRDPTPIIWGDCPVADIQENPGVGYIFYDEFRDLPLLPTETTQISYGRYKVYATTSAVVQPVAYTTVNSVVQPAPVLNHSVVVSTTASLAQTFQQFRMSGVPGTDGKLWFEASIAIVGIAPTTQGFFLGLGETEKLTLAAGVPLSSTAATSSNTGAMIGFQSIETGPLAINTVYADRATSFTTIQAGVAGTQPGSFGPTAYTFTKLGFVYDPSRSADCVRFYQDGVLLPNYLSSTALLATTYLKAGTLGLILGVLGTGTGGTFTRWWRCAQLFV